MEHEYVTLIPSRDGTGQIQWTMVYKDKPGKKGGFPDIDLGNDAPVMFTYTIVNPANLNIGFDHRPAEGQDPKVKNALWVVEGSGTAKKPGIHTDQIEQVGIQANTTQLRFKDKNSDHAILTYQLNFLNRDNPAEQVTALDPEIRNGGGGEFLGVGLEWVAATLGLITLALFAGLWFGKRSARKAA